MANILGQSMPRRPRRPVHTASLRHQPFLIQPFMIAPVLPGETMDGLLFQCRAVSDPIKNPLIGWWLEHHFFYVKMRDLVSPDADSAILQNMLLQPGFDVSSLKLGTTLPELYSADGAMHYTYACLRRIVASYFRAGDEDSTVSYGKLGTFEWMAHVKNSPGWMDSLAAGAPAAGDDIELLDISAGTAGGGDDKLMISEVDAAMRQWALLSMQGLTTQTFDEYLATYGIRQPLTELHVPELLRSFVEWQYPSNTIDPTSGAARSAVSWSVRGSADKRRFFMEPGFIIGVSICRPKVYFRNQLGSFAEFLDNAYKWLPAVLWDQRLSGYANYSDTADSPLDPAVITAPFSADARDLFMRGDQFIQGSLAATDRNMVSLPAADLVNRRYPTQADITALFVTVGTQYIRQDIAVNLTIMSSMPKDFSPDGAPGQVVVA